MQFSVPLLHGASKNMNVKGSVASPVVFQYQPNTPLTQVVSLTCFLVNDGSDIFQTYTGHLSNGLIIQYNVGNVAYNQMISGKTDLIALFNSNLSDAEGLVGTVAISPMVLSPGDSVKVLVQDDLRDLQYLAIYLQIIK